MADGDEESEEDGEVSFKKPLELFEQKKIVRICAPMVRYSKLPFRTLVRRYGCDLAYTPMIVSDSFIKSVKARDMEFTTNAGDRPLIVQFAASNPKDFADAAEIVAPFSDGVDLNCGCPQRWAMQEGYGAKLIRTPALIKDIVRQTVGRIPGFPVSIKIRIHDDLSKTVQLCQQAEKAGVAWITVHGRTTRQRGEPANWDAIKLIQESVLIPVVANGDIKTESDIINVHEKTGVSGVMAARGILNNPAMFAGYQSTPLQCVADWVDVALSLGIPFTNFHHHLIYMLEKVTTKADRRVFSELKSIPSVLEYLRVNYNI
ncbi:tRNA-dihydrouridine(20a/20b) synthase [NAD(P)+]-like isoform X1 [Pocillopora verrucosa]|uniref:tRNA-dihydrouridine(20a/20b) synthase [NAD(P)+]-like isoform X1 n=1 Tax=Pocillopora verrucosa TaxID=203993 RepID=UPI00334110E3